MERCDFNKPSALNLAIYWWVAACWEIYPPLRRRHLINSWNQLFAAAFRGEI